MATLPVQYPLGLPTVSGNAITVDMMLNQPTRVTRYLSDLTLQGFFANRVFTSAGGVTGGAVLYSQLTTNDLYSDRDVQNVEPGAEFPIVTASRPTPLVAQVEKFGGKFFVTDEARRRNDSSGLRIEATKLANTIQRKIHQRAISVLDASITAVGSAVQMTGNNWSNIVTAGTSAVSNSAYPAADFAKAQLKADTAELGVTYNLWLVNPQEMANFQITYGDSWRSVLNSWGVDMVATNRVTAGTAYVVAEGQTGEMRMETPLSTETWREPETQRTWAQSDVSPVFYVTNPYSALKVSGLAG